MNDNEPMLIVDVANIYMRSKSKLRSLQTDTGLRTGGLFGYIRTVEGIKREFKVQHVVHAMEGKGSSSKRREIDESYKADRPKNRGLFDEFHEAAIFDYAIGSGDLIVQVEKHEADDVIAATVKAFPDSYKYVLSMDHDFLALLDENTEIIRGSKDKRYDYIDFAKDYGFTADNYRKVLAIAGDSSDNISGVPGYGVIKAKKLLENADWNLSKAVREGGLEEHRKKIDDNLSLVTPHHIDTSILVKAFNERPKRNVELLRELYEQWQFNSLLKALDNL
ncbi:hypothetical protein EBZ39_17165 [bacterium]|nr:hypothetical protein [bacterium]